MEAYSCRSLQVFEDFLADCENQPFTKESAFKHTLVNSVDSIDCLRLKNYRSVCEAVEAVREKSAASADSFLK